jgi:hypothetical protein
MVQSDHYYQPRKWASLNRRPVGAERRRPQDEKSARAWRSKAEDAGKPLRREKRPKTAARDRRPVRKRDQRPPGTPTVGERGSCASITARPRRRNPSSPTGCRVARSGQEGCRRSEEPRLPPQLCRRVYPRRCAMRATERENGGCHRRSPVCLLRGNWNSQSLYQTACLVSSPFGAFSAILGQIGADFAAVSPVPLYGCDRVTAKK